MRLLTYLALLALLLPTLPAHADLTKADGMFVISAREVGWTVHFTSQGYKLSHERHRRDGKGHFYLFTNASTGLHLSFSLVPAKQCASAPDCWEYSWQHRHASMANAQGVTRFERNGFALTEFLVELPVPEELGRMLTQFHFSGHLVRDGYWVDMHLSRMPYIPKDR
jgi:hypothetical protein